MNLYYFKASSFVDHDQVKGPVELHPAELPAEAEVLPDPNVEKILSGFGSPQVRQFKFSFVAPTD